MDEEAIHYWLQDTVDNTPLERQDSRADFYSRVAVVATALAEENKS